MKVSRSIHRRILYWSQICMQTQTFKMASWRTMKRNLNIEYLYILKYKLVYDRDTSIHFLALNTTMRIGERIQPVSATHSCKPAPRRPVQKWISPQFSLNFLRTYFDQNVSFSMCQWGHLNLENKIIWGNNNKE